MQQKQKKLPWKTLFDLELPEGRCLGLQMDTTSSSSSSATSDSSVVPIVTSGTLSSDSSLSSSVSWKEDENANNNNDDSNNHFDNHYWIRNCLHPKEVEYAMSQPSENAQQTFVLGRLAMRQLLLLQQSQQQHESTSPSVSRTMASQQQDELCCSNSHGRHVHDVAILKDDHGRPTLPLPYVGSISHKRCCNVASSGCGQTTTGVALLSSTSTTAHPSATTTRIGVGVDIEQSYSRKRSIAKRVLTRHEMNDLGKLKGVTMEEEVLLRFSLKESLYKAMHPLICQYVGFQEAQVTPHDDGTASVEWNLKNDAHLRFDQTTAHWRRVHDFFLSSASVTLNNDDDAGDHSENEAACNDMDGPPR